MSLATSVALIGLLGVPTPQRLTAEVEDAYAVRVNPAGLGLLRGSELRLVYGYDEGRFRTPSQRIDSNGLGVFGALRVFDAFTLGAGWERDWLDPGDLGTTHLGAGWGGGPVAFGVSWRRVDRLGDDESVDRWDLGLSLRPFSWLAAGLRVWNVGETLGQRRYDIGLAVRPGWDRLLVSGTWRLTEEEELTSDTLDLEARIEAEVIPGLRLGIGTNQDLDVFGQLGLDFGYASVGGFAHSVNERLQAGGELVVRRVPANSLVVIGKVVVMELSGALVPEPEYDLLRGQMRVTPYGDVVRTVRALAGADGVRGLRLEVGPLEIGWAKAEELRRAIATFRRAGRRVDCNLRSADDVTYFVVSACSEITAAPPAFLSIDGIASTNLYFGEALARIGVEVEVERFGVYKSSPDQLTRGDMSTEERERLGRYLDVVVEVARDGVAEGRGLGAERVRSLLDRAVLTATAARMAGLIDALVYPDEIDERIAEHYGGRPIYVRPANVLTPKSPRPWRRPDAVALIHLDAPITRGASSASPFGLGRTVGSDDLVAALERARQDHRVVAVVLRVDSPGGDAVASDLVAHAVARVAEEKPVVASFGDVAASGGYYAAAPAGRIYAEATTLTGSIGIFNLDLDLSGLLERMGIGVEVLTRGELAATSNPFIGRSAPGRAAVRRALDAAYRRFLEVVARGRGKTVEEIEALAEGRIWTGRDAKQVGLVDELGGLVEALRAAAREAGRVPSELEVITFPDPYQPLGGPLGELASALGLRPEPSVPGWVRTLVGRLGPDLAARLPLLTSRAPLAMMPWVVEVE